MNRRRRLWCRTLLAIIPLLSGCVTEDPYPRGSLVERFQERKALRDRLVSYLESLDCVARAEVVFGEDHVTGSERVALIVSPVEGIYDPSRERAIVREVARLSGRPAATIELFRSTH